MGTFTHFPLPELEQGFDLGDPLNTARFRLVPDRTTQTLELIGRTIRPLVVLQAQPEGGGVLRQEYLDRHAIDTDSLEDFLRLKAEALREHFLPSLRPELTEVEVHCHKANGVVDARLIIQERIVGLDNHH